MTAPLLTQTETNFNLPELPPPEKGEHGWMLPALLRADTLLYGRWDYLADCWPGHRLPQHSIPLVPFLGSPDKETWKMLTNSLDAIARFGGGWQGWSGPEYFRFFLEWLLHGFGHRGHVEAPKEPSGCEGALERLEGRFDLALWQSQPYDYLGDLLAQNAYGKRQGFYPTPHTVVEMMAQMLFAGEKRDARVLTVCDPCVGTGRMLLHASNFSLRLYGMDIDPLVCLATLVNGYLFAPWLVRPLPFLDGAQYDESQSARIAEAMAAQAPPHQRDKLDGTTHDGENAWRFEPVKKRVKGGDSSALREDRQGVLF